MTLAELYQIILERKAHLPAGSYTTTLLQGGLPRLAQKVGEEAAETLVAALTEDNRRLVEEAADLLYHLLVLLAARNIPWQAVEAELERRRR